MQGVGADNTTATALIAMRKTKEQLQSVVNSAQVDKMTTSTQLIDKFPRAKMQKLLQNLKKEISEATAHTTDGSANATESPASKGRASVFNI